MIMFLLVLWGLSRLCTHCNENFPSKTILHKHLKNCYCQRSQTPTPALAIAASLPDIPIVESTATPTGLGTGFGFGGWSYATIAITLKPGPLGGISEPDSRGCLDTGFGVTLINCDWLMRQLPKQLIAKMVTLLKVRGIGSTKHETDEYVIVSLYLIGENHEGSPTYVCI